MEYTVTVTFGSTRFNTDIGTEYSQQTLEAATKFTWTILQQQYPPDRKNFNKVSLFIDDMEAIGDTRNNEVHVSARYIQRYSGNVKEEITGCLYHAVAQVWLWNGNGEAPLGLINGIADFVRLKSGHAPGHWARPGQGNKWDQGYEYTARFLDYCDGLRGGTFVAELNKKMRNGYTDGYFLDLLGKSVDTLWADYKAFHNCK